MTKSERMSIIGKSNSKQNKWEFKDDIAIGFTFKGEKFYIDLEDYNKVKRYCWRIDKYGYVVANKKDTTNTMIRIHRIITDAIKTDIVDRLE